MLNVTTVDFEDTTMNNTNDTFEDIASDAVDLLLAIIADLVESDDGADQMAGALIAVVGRVAHGNGSLCVTIQAKAYFACWTSFKSSVPFTGSGGSRLWLASVRSALAVVPQDVRTSCS